MNDSGCFFKALPSKGFAQKGKKCKGGKKSKQRMTAAFLIRANGGMSQYSSGKAKNHVVLNVKAPHQNLSKFLISQMQSHGYKLI